MIDLHSHTNESDGTLTPAELVRLAVLSDLQALAITDHDTFSGYEGAIGPAAECKLELLRGIELNSRLERPGERTRWVHILAYFPSGQVAPNFIGWLQSQLDERRDRNRKLADRLQQEGVDISLAEVEAKGRSLAGRPHFARLLMEKGYVASLDEAFRRYVGDEAPSFVERQSSSTAEVVQMVRDGGGIPVVAHPIRVGLAPGVEREWLASLKNKGLLGLEVYHSEHSEQLQAYYRDLADDLQLVPTGGSDFHGAAKPDILLGSGRNGNVSVAYDILSGLKALSSNEVWSARRMF